MRFKNITYWLYKEYIYILLQSRSGLKNPFSKFINKTKINKRWSFVHNQSYFKLANFIFIQYIQHFYEIWVTKIIILIEIV